MAREIPSSYLHAYMSSPEKQPRSPSSPATTLRYKTVNQPSMSFSQQRSPSQPIAALTRRVPTSPSRKNVENIDTQFERDKVSFEKHANTYRRLAGEKYHHNKPPNSILTLWEEGHIADRGRAKVAEKEDKGLFDPILSHFIVPPTPASSTGRQRPSSAPHMRPTSSGGGSPPPSQAHKVVQANMGRYNPLTHTYHAQNPPSPTHAALKLREFDRANGGPSLGLVAKVDARGSFDPINGEWKALATTTAPSAATSAAAAALQSSCGATEATAGNSADVSSAAVPPASSSGTAAAASPAPRAAPRAASAPHQRPLGSSKRNMAADWGTYNPIHHSWTSPAKDTSKHRDQNTPAAQRAGIVGGHLAPAPLPATQGVYNPILNSWTVPPADARVRAGLTFAPATLFIRPTPSTIRVK